MDDGILDLYNSESSSIAKETEEDIQWESTMGLYEQLEADAIPLLLVPYFLAS